MTISRTITRRTTILTPIAGIFTGRISKAALSEPNNRGFYGAEGRPAGILRHSDEAGISMAAWDACAKSIGPSRIYDRPSFAGLSLSQCGLSACVIVIPTETEYVVIPHYWTPEDTWLYGRLRGTDHPPMGTKGSVSDFERIFSDVKVFAKRYQIQEISMDPFASCVPEAALGIPTVAFSPTVCQIGGAFKTFSDLLDSGKIVHAGHSTLREEVGNVVLKRDSKGNITPSKRISRIQNTGSIDGVIAMVMAVHRATHQPKKFFRPPDGDPAVLTRQEIDSLRERGMVIHEEFGEIPGKPVWTSDGNLAESFTPGPHTVYLNDRRIFWGDKLSADTYEQV